MLKSLIQRVNVRLYMSRRFLPLLFMCWQSIGLAKTLTLEEIVQLTLSRNVNIENAAIQRVLQRYNVDVAWNVFDPKFLFTGGGTYNENQDDFGNYTQTRGVSAQPGATLFTAIGTQFSFAWENDTTRTNSNGSISNAYNSQPSISVTQPLLQGFGVTVNTNNLQTTIEQEVINLLTFRALVNTQITASINAYYGVIAAKEGLVIQKNAYKRAKELLDRTKHLIDEGRIAKNEIFEVEAQVAQQALNISTAELSLNQARLALFNQLDLSSDEYADKDVSDKIYLTSIYPKPRLATDLATKYNVNLQQALVSIVQAERQLFIAENQNEWQLNLNLMYQLNGGQSDENMMRAFRGIGDTDVHNTTASLNFAMPLGNDLTRKQIIVAARVNLLQSQRTAKVLERELESQITTDIESLKLLRESLKNQEATAELRRKAAESATLKYNEGRLSAFELTTLQDNLTAAEESVITAKISLAQALANFDSEIGTTVETWCVQMAKQENRFGLEGDYK